MEKKYKEVPFKIALIPVAFLLISLVLSLLVFDLGEAQIAMVVSAMFAGFIAIKYLGYEWSELEEGILESIKVAMSAVLILLIIGMVVGTWMLAGVVPTMIYYGLKILSPGIFLIATLIICSIVSLATGSSWTTCATVGIALMGVGQGLGVPVPMIAGAIISGAYFGDKMSPLSDTTNLAPAMAGCDLFEHIKHMIFTTGPSYIISLILFGILGMKYAGQALNQEGIDILLNGITSTFNVTPLLLLAPVFVIILVIKKIPAIPGLFGGVVIGGVFAYIFQGASVGEILNVANNGFTSNVGVKVVDKLLSRGGMQGMLWTVSLILCAMMYGGIMEKSGMLHAIAKKILSYTKDDGSLISAAVLTCISMNFIASDQYLSIVIPGRMYKDAFDERGLHPKNLSRVLEDSGTLVAPLVPWNTGGAYVMATLGLAPWTYVPFCFLCLINPIISMIYGYLGFTIEKVDKAA
ncbi:Na+/H+ antiporter NhaC [Wukongibacter baidiensis]|uniref:Na+/H+ antiporter NhaC n=1 Tax=Wukongibacter baidiensis TaxID=1723361 RepID=UPI003D7FE803